MNANKRTALIAGAIVGGAALLLGTVGAVALMARHGPGYLSGYRQSVRDRKNVGGSENPWPECAEIVKELKKNVSDPEGFEVVEWLKREPVTGYTREVITLRFRAKNIFGARMLWSGVANVDDGVVTSVSFSAAL